MFGCARGARSRRPNKQGVHVHQLAPLADRRRGGGRPRDSAFLRLTLRNISLPLPFAGRAVCLGGAVEFLLREMYTGRFRAAFRQLRPAVPRRTADESAVALAAPLWLFSSRAAATTTEEMQARARAASDAKRKAAEAEANGTMFIFDRALKSAQACWRRGETRNQPLSAFRRHRRTPSSSASWRQIRKRRSSPPLRLLAQRDRAAWKMAGRDDQLQGEVTERLLDRLEASTHLASPLLLLLLLLVSSLPRAPGPLILLERRRRTARGSLKTLSCSGAPRSRSPGAAPPPPSLQCPAASAARARLSAPSSHRPAVIFRPRPPPPASAQPRPRAAASSAAARGSSGSPISTPRPPSSTPPARRATAPRPPPARPRRRARSWLGTRRSSPLNQARSPHDPSTTQRIPPSETA